MKRWFIEEYFRFKIWNAVFVLVRLASAVIAVLTLWYGLRSNETPYMDPANGNFNTAFIRLAILEKMWLK